MFKKWFSKQTNAKFINIYPPYLGAGIKLKSVNEEFTKIVVEMPLTRLNKNYVGTHFGGSLYAMCDPFFMLILIEHLGNDYIVWDSAAKIEFKKPGKDTVTGVFEIPLIKIKEIKDEVDEIGKNNYVFYAQVKGEGGEIVAEVEKTDYVRKKDFVFHKIETKSNPELIFDRENS